MGRGTGESAVKVGTLTAKTFYDTQAFQYGVQDKWGYSIYHSGKDKEHSLYPQKPDSGLFIKPWEFGGHPHDFWKATRGSRTDDPYLHYERGKALERHVRLVAEADAWRRRELLKEEMLIQMSKVQAVERQRSQFQELRRHLQLEQLNWSRPGTSGSQTSRCGSNPGQPQTPGSVNLSTQGNSLRGGGHTLCGSKRVSRSAPTSTRPHWCPVRILAPGSARAKEEIKELDLFDAIHGT